MPQTLSQIKALLAERGLHPRHRLGQNFLADPNKLRLILDTAAVSPGEHILEVGPGTGVLTEPMLEAGARVVAVELDNDLAGLLRDRIGPNSDTWTLIHGDVLATKHAMNPAIEQALGGREAPFKLIANLPYQIASPLLATLAIDWPGLTAALVMVQREVADRILAPPGNKQFGPLTILLQAAFEGRRVTMLSPGCFWPPPKIESAVIELVRREQPLTGDLPRLAEFTQTLFQKRRKQLGAILGRDFPFPDDIAPSARPEQLSVQQIIHLSKR
jgi:16S rRNA (adenine1518-N6/adenine1519-N6)-dimethyltransferase